MTFDWNISIGDIIAFIALLGSITMFVLTTIKQAESKDSAQSANDFYDAAKKYYDLMVEFTPTMLGKADSETKEVKSASCDASIVRIGKGKWIFKIYNKGNENAGNIVFKYLVDGAPTILSPQGNAFPIKLLEPQKNVDYHFMVNMGNKGTSWEYEITWTNEDGKEDSKKGVLTLPLS